jgi:hypothetical protein
MASLSRRIRLPYAAPQDLILREHTRAQERLDDAALELERVRTELIHSTSQPVKKGRGGDGAESRRHMAFF